MRAWQDAANILLGELADYHRRFPLRKGMPRGELRSRLTAASPGGRLTLRLFNAWIAAAAAQGIVEADDAAVWRTEFRVTLTDAQTAAVDRTLAALAKAGVSPPNANEVLAMLRGDTELVEMLVEQGRLVRVGADLFYGRSEFDGMVDAARAALTANGSLSLAEARDLWQTSRKYAQAVIEEMDNRHITRRVGDTRVLR